MVRIVKPAWVCHGREKSGKAKPIFSVDIHPDGKRFATAGADNTVRIWSMAPLLSEDAESDPAVHKKLATLSGHTRPVNCVRWAGKSQMLASASDDHLALLWTLRSSDSTRKYGNLEQKQVENWRLLGRLSGHNHDVTDLAWAPDESKLATCSLDNSVKVWDVQRDASGQRLQCLVTLTHGSMVKGVAWDPMGKYLSSASDDLSVAIWRCADWQREHTIEQPYQKEGRTFFRRLSWSPDGVYVATSHGFKEPQHISPVLRRTRNFEIECDFVGHKKAIVSTRFNPAIFKKPSSSPPQEADNNGTAEKSQHYTCVAIGSQDKSFSVWVASQVRPILVSQTFFEGSVLDITWGHDGYTLMSCSYDGSVVLFRFDPAELGPKVDCEERDQILTSLYGGTSDLSGQALANIPESAEQLELENAPTQSPPDKLQTSAAMASSSAINLLSTKPKTSSIGTSSSQAQVIVHQPTVRKGGKRRIAPMLISSGGSDSRVVGALESRLGAPGGQPVTSQSRPTSKRRVDVMPAGSDSRSNSMGTNAPASASAQSLASEGNTMYGTKRIEGHDSSSTTAMVQNRRLQISGTRRQPTTAAAVVRPQTPLVGSTANTAGRCTLVKDIGMPPHNILLEASVEESSSSQLGLSNTASARNGEYIVSASTANGLLWQDKLSPAAVPTALGGNGHTFTVVGCCDGSLYTYTRTGRRLLPTIVLGGGGIAILEVSAGGGNHLLAVTVDGSVFVWNMEEASQPRRLLHTSAAPVLGSTARGDSQVIISQAFLTAGGSVMIVLSDGNAFGYDGRVGAWLRVVDQSFVNSEFQMQRASQVSGNSTALSTVRVAAAQEIVHSRRINPFGHVSALHASVGDARTAGSIRQQSLAHLETLLGSTLMLGRGSLPDGTTSMVPHSTTEAQDEYRAWLRVYAGRLAEDVLTERARELCESLLGPPHSRRHPRRDGSASASQSTASWDPMVLGMQKRTLLSKVVLPAFAQKSRVQAFQRLCTEFQADLDALQTEQPINLEVE